MHLRKKLFRKLNFRALALGLIMLFSNLNVLNASATEVKRDDCTDVMFIFARGSGVEIGSNRDYVPFHDAMVNAFKNSGLSLNFYELGSFKESDLSYPAPGIGISTWQRFTTSLGALITSGEAYSYGESVEEGADEAMLYLLHNRSRCPNSKFVLAGYSQGAQVVSRALQKVSPKMVFAAFTFGDPKLYLPEGKRNLFTQTTLACSVGSSAFSDYRSYVPDCYAYQGILQGYVPYELTGYSGKLHAYCQFHDVICSSYIDIDNLAYGHASYAEQGTYDRATRDLYNMIYPGTYKTPTQDLAIILDVSGTSGRRAADLQGETFRAAQKVFKNNGRVALYTYGEEETEDYREVCGFDTCASENLRDYISSIKFFNNTPDPNSLLSSTFEILKTLRWSVDGNKSMILLTDKGLKNPDKKQVTVQDVARLGYKIDPVNLYFAVDEAVADDYSELASLTDGKVLGLGSNWFDALDDLTDTALAHTPNTEIYNSFASLPAVATTKNLSITKTSSDSISVSFSTDALYNVLTLNDGILGYMDTNSITISEIDFSKENTVCLSPISSDGYRGDPVCTTIPAETVATEETSLVSVPKAPNTGKM